VTLVAGADTDPERLASFGADWAIESEHLYSDYRELLARERPDLVSICAYAPERLEMARAAIEAGARGLWLEKAVGCSMAEADELYTLADRAGVAVVVNHMRRADPAWRRVAEIVASGELGRLESVHVRFSGHFLHTGTHAWDLLDEWCGAWAEVRCWSEGQEGSRAEAQREGQEGSRAEAQREGQEGSRAGGQADGDADVDADTGWAARAVASDPSGLAHVIFANGVHAFVSASRKRYFIFDCDLTFTEGRIQIGNDVRRVFRPAPSPRYEGFVELAETGEALAAEAPVSLLDALLEAIETGRDRLTSLDTAIRALHLGLGVSCAAASPGRLIVPADVSHELRIESV
jgi:predicted dehydrogenase